MFFFFFFFFFNFQKNRSQKLINAKRKTKTVLKFALNSAQRHEAIFNFRLILSLFFIFPLFFVLWPAIKKIRPENLKSLCAEFNADSKTVFVFLLALIVFDFYSFEGPEYKLYRWTIFIIIIGYLLLLSSFYITIWMLLITESYLLHFILCFSYELVYFMHLVIMTSPHYYDVTQWNLHSRCKIENKNCFINGDFLIFSFVFNL